MCLIKKGSVLVSLLSSSSSSWFSPQAVVHLQLHVGVQVRFLATWKDFADHITMMTKSIAEVPFK